MNLNIFKGCNSLCIIMPSNRPVQYSKPVSRHYISSSIPRSRARAGAKLNCLRIGGSESKTGSGTSASRDAARGRI